MVNLINIKKVDNVVVYNYYPEGQQLDLGYVEYNFVDDVVIKSEYCSLDNGIIKMYFSKALKAIKNMLSKNEHTLPDEKVVMWY